MRRMGGFGVLAAGLMGALLMSAGNAGAQAVPALGAPLGRVVLHAHNCFPEGDQWTDRLDRALGTQVQPIAIEQDVMWYVDPATGRGRTVLAHGGEPTGTEPTIEQYFFARVRPIIERALQENRRETWPVVYLHFNFRNNDAAHLQDVWDTLAKYEAWLTTAERTADERTVMPLSTGPLMVLTESGQEAVFYDRVPVGGRLRVFGTVATGRTDAAAGASRDAQAAAAVATSPEALMPNAATNYRRWVNFPWAVVEQGGQPAAGGWTPTDNARLKALVDRAHALKLAIRFYTLNGHAPAESKGWSAGYNFGSVDAARQRWQAAIAAGVDLLATDQYELLANELVKAK